MLLYAVLSFALYVRQEKSQAPDPYNLKAKKYKTSVW